MGREECACPCAVTAALIKDYFYNTLGLTYNKEYHYTLSVPGYGDTIFSISEIILFSIFLPLYCLVYNNKAEVRKMVSQLVSFLKFYFPKTSNAIFIGAFIFTYQGTEVIIEI